MAGNKRIQAEAEETLSTLKEYPQHESYNVGGQPADRIDLTGAPMICPASTSRARTTFTCSANLPKRWASSTAEDLWMGLPREWRPRTDSDTAI